jgi:L-fuconolactonase
VIVDAHHHLWDPARADYPWMTDEVAAIRRPFGPDDLRPLLERCGVERTVVVQARAGLDETRDLLATAAATDFVAGVVGWVDLTDPGVARTLDELRAGPDGRWLAGVRHQVHDEPDPAWLLRPDVRRGLRAVGDAGLVYDLLVRPRELPAALVVARELTGMRFVVDHLAKPRVRDGGDAEWEAALAPLSELPNVVCKVSGLVTEADHDTWGPEELAPFVTRALDWFGAGRLLFGSDWPVCLLAASYEQVLDALLAVMADQPASVLAAVLGGNAARVYRLPI